MRRAAATATRLLSQYATSSLEQALSSVAAHVIVPSHIRRCVESPTTFQASIVTRPFSSNVDVTKEVDAVNELFAAARDEIEYAKEEAETVYFDESVKEAKRAVDACLGRWEALLAAVSEEERNRVVRSMGLKIAQLQAEYDEVSKLHLED